MTRGNTFRLLRRARFFVFVGLAVSGLLLSASAANAGCFDGKAAAGVAAFLTAHAPVPVIQQQGDQDQGNSASIVGMWHVIYTATASTAGPLAAPVVPPGSFVFAETMKQWHADGTEWEEKFEPAPAGYCFGVWKQTANGGAKLRHFGAVTAPDGSVAFIFYIEETDFVRRDGMSYVGTWDFKLYGAADVFGTGPVIQEFSGTLAATRITVN